MLEELPLAAFWGARPGLSWEPCQETPTGIQAVQRHSLFTTKFEGRDGNICGGSMYEPAGSAFRLHQMFREGVIPPGRLKSMMQERNLNSLGLDQ